jgi:Family of unknown function (DUF6049)
MSAMPRPLLTGAAATAIAACVVVLSALALPGSATAAAGRPQDATSSSPVTVTITSVNPQFAQPGKTVTVSGTLSNTTGDPISGLSVQLLSSSSPFGNRTELQDYSDGDFFDEESAVANADYQLPGTLASHATANWSVQLSPAQLSFLGTFGVYPLAAQAFSADSGAVGINRTFLPFWPNNQAQNPSVQQIAWIWPLIDQPRQAACRGLLDNSLAASFASGGRLAGLLAAGSQYPNAHLTWAIDPALLANANTMTSRYQVDGPDCKGTAYPPSLAAGTWLADLRHTTATQPVFVTPYDDADIAALTHGSMSTDLTQAFTVGRKDAGKILNRSFIPTAGAAGPAMNGTAWPADGIANYSDLENIAAKTIGINTVVLDSSTMPPTTVQNFTPSAQTSSADGEGGDLSVLLSDHTITQILSSANSASDSKGAAFSVAQRYLAETAMITAERPALARSIVVTPPRRWDPPAGLASKLLDETVNAPWLRPTSLGQLATEKNPTGEVPRVSPPNATSSDELSPSLVAQASQLDQQASLLQNLQATRDATYNTEMSNAVMAVESSAWRGGGAALGTGQALAQQSGLYLADQAGKVTIIGAPRVTLGGLTGSVPVSVSNELNFPVRVGLQAASNGRVTVKEPHRTIVVPAGQQEIIKLQVTAEGVGSTTLQLSLVSPAGGRLPATSSVIIQATHYGDFALVIIVSALGVFLLTAAARAFRRGSRGPGVSGPQPPQPPENDGSERFGDEPGGRETGPGQRGLHGSSEGADTVMSDGGGTGEVTVQTRDHNRAEATDDYAWTPGQAERR